MTTASSQAVEHMIPSRVSVVIPVFNGGPDLEKCLAAVAASTHPLFEIILVDDGSTDGMTGPVAGTYGARVIRLDRSCGPATARNLGAREARGEIIFFTDADVVLHPDALAIAANALAVDPRLSAVFGSYDDQPGHSAFLSQYRNLFHHWVHQMGNHEASTFWTGCGAIRRDVLLEMGGFSEKYSRPSIEDIELGARMRRAGLRIRLEKTMLGKHMKHWRLWNLVKTDVLHRGMPWMGLLLREGRAPSDLNLRIGSRIATILAAFFGLSLLVFPAIGHAAAIWPALAFLFTGIISALLSNPTGGRRGETLFFTTLAVIAPIGVYSLAPDPWTVVPMALLMGLIWTQLSFYRYIIQKRSAAFALAVVPMQMLFFLGCAAAIPLGFIQYYLGRQPAKAINAESDRSG